MYEEEPDLESVMIKVSIGIGRNISEAEESLKVAKQKKGESRYFNIEVYAGEPLQQPKEPPNPVVESFMRLEQRLLCDGIDESLTDLHSLKYDPKTGLLNRMGYEVEVQKLKKRRAYEDRVIILIDGDDMKQANTKLGYQGTDDYLEAIGRALQGQIRRGGFSTDGLRDCDVLVNRKNDSGGDEFIVDLNCNYNRAIRIAMRYVLAMYRSQAELGKRLAFAEGF